MNLNIIREEISKKKSSRVEVTVYGLRNKIYRYEGIIVGIYPNFFTIDYRGDEKSFNYRDIVTKDVKIKYL